MKYEKDIAAHVISNIALIENSMNVITDIEQTVCRQFNALVKRYVEDSEIPLSKDHKFEFADKGLEFSCENWERSNTLLAGYCFDHGEEYVSNEDLFTLTHFLGEHSPNASLRLQFYLNKDELGLNLRQLKNNLREAFLNNEPLQNLGFKFSECKERLELKIHLDKKIVAEEYPDLDKSFKPVIEALDKLNEAHPHFETLVDSMKASASIENN